MIWVGLVVLVFVCGLVLARPLLRPSRDLKVADPLSSYRDALAALDRDVEEGVRPTADIEEDRREIERRMLNESRKARGGNRPLGGSAIQALTLASVLIVGLGGVLLYRGLGAPDQPGQPYVASPDAEHAKRAELAALAETLRQNVLASDEAPAQAWAALGLSYMQLGRFEAASAALAQAVRKQPDALAFRQAYAESLIFAGGGTIGPEAKKAIDAVLMLDPGNEAARYYLARYFNQEGDHASAMPLLMGIADGLEKGDPKRFQVLSELWMAAVALDRPVPERFLPPPQMREALKQRGIDVPLPEGEASGQQEAP